MSILLLDPKMTRTIDLQNKLLMLSSKVSQKNIEKRDKKWRINFYMNLLIIKMEKSIKKESKSLKCFKFLQKPLKKDIDTAS